MGKNLIKVTGFRFADNSILTKLALIAKAHKRTRNQEVEWALSEYVRQYEEIYGIIQTDETER